MIPDYTDESGKIHNSGKAHLILTNPPFGTSEGESLTEDDIRDYDIKSTRGQSLFIQKMISSIEDESRIVTVIDEGVLNTNTYSVLREHILQECRIEFVLSLPEETFKPNKINVKSSVLVLTKREFHDEELEDDYPIIFIKLMSLGYDGSGNELRGFDLTKLINEIKEINLAKILDKKIINGYNWEGFKVQSSTIIEDRTKRLDFKYYDISIINKIASLKKKKGYKTIKEINLIPTGRGKSPIASEYVSESEGFALVVKAGSNISKNGTLITKGDYIEESIYQVYSDKEQTLQDGDILLASTGDGTLGKCCVYRSYDNENNIKPAIADGHVTIIRADQKTVYPEYLCDYLRKGFGADQINRLFTGATGLIEITPDDVNEIIIPPLLDIHKQRQLSEELRNAELMTEETVQKTFEALKIKEEEFYKITTT